MKRSFILFFSTILALAIFSGCEKKEEEKKPVIESEEPEEISDYSVLSIKDLEVLAYGDDPVACYYLGLTYDLGLQDENQNYPEAFTWYEKAASFDHAEANTALGYMYMNGLGVDKDLEKAREYFEQAYLLGDDEANVGLGRTYLTENEVSEEDAILAHDYIRQASEDGCVDGLYYMGYLYQHGYYVKQDYGLAMSFYKRAAEATDLDLTLQYITDAANTSMAVLYVNGYGVEQDYELAMDLLEQASENSYRVADYYIGVIYENGYGVDQNYEKAMEYYQLAADQDFAPALNQIGYLYFNGLGVDTSFEQAIYYQKLAAAQDYTPAQINLGYMYENGYGVEQDYLTALAYYKLAAEKNYEGAKEAVARVEKQQTH